MHENRCMHTNSRKLNFSVNVSRSQIWIFSSLLLILFRNRPNQKVAKSALRQTSSLRNPEGQGPPPVSIWERSVPRTSIFLKLVLVLRQFTWIAKPLASFKQRVLYYFRAVQHYSCSEGVPSDPWIKEIISRDTLRVPSRQGATSAEPWVS